MRGKYYLTDLAGQVPSLGRTSVELVAAVLELYPVAGTPQLIRVGASLQVIGGGIRINNIRKRISKLINIEPCPIS